LRCEPSRSTAIFAKESVEPDTIDFAMSHSWDYIVVGAGHNGLVAACTLAKAGRKVLVVEQRGIPGGLSVSHPFVTAAPQHILSVGAMDDALMAHSPMIDFLGLRGYGYDAIALDAPYGWMGEDGETLLLQKDFDKTLEDIRYFSPKDAQTYADIRSAVDFVIGGLEAVMPHHPARIPKRLLWKMALDVVRDRKMRKVLGRMMSVSAFELFGELFESEAMRGLWAYWAGMFAPATVQASGAYLAAFGSVHRAGIFRPVGGMSGMIRALEKCLVAHGGELRCGQKVEQLLLDGQRVRGVRIVGGEELHAKHGVLANCAPQVALGKLMPASAIDHELRHKIDHIPANSVAVAPFKIDVAVGGPVTYPKAQAKRDRRDGRDVRKTTFMTGTLEQHIAQHQACLRGDPVEFRPPLYFVTLSANDAGLAPKGQDVFYLYVNTPIRPIGGWDAAKPTYSAQIRSAVRHYVDGLDAEIGSVEHSPKDFEEGFGAPNGAYFHVDMIVSRMLMHRPAPGLGGYKTPFDGLYLAGAGSHPSGGVCGWPGRLAAEQAMRDQR
jgi:phytoene dehydrogenase-like protein